MDAGTREPGVMARRLFEQTELGDRRRTRRLVASAEQIMRHPQGTLPEKMGGPAALDGLYRLMDSPTVTHERLISAAGACTRQAMQAHDGVVLVIHDTTTLDYSGLHSVKDLGPIGPVGGGRRRGLLAHNSLAVTADRQVLGLAHQILHRRRRTPKGETKRQRQGAEARESRLWKNACRALAGRGGGSNEVDVADRGADVTEFLAFEKHAGRSHLVRSCQNRRVEVIDEQERAVKDKLHDLVRSLAPPSSTRRTLKIPARDQRPAREAEVAVAWMKLSLVAPLQPRGEHEPKERLPIWAVRVWEVDPPQSDDVEPVEWILLTNMPVTEESEAWERVDWYSVRWVIEEYHKSLKTGLSIEQMQFTSRDRLDPAIALYSVIGTWLLEWRDMSRDEDRCRRRAGELVPMLWVIILSTWRHQEPRPDWTIGEFLFALARLGGHQNRKHDHAPGWLVLWRGWRELQAMINGAQALAEAMKHSRCGET